MLPEQHTAAGTSQSRVDWSLEPPPRAVRTPPAMDGGRPRPDAASLRRGRSAGRAWKARARWTVQNPFSIAAPQLWQRGRAIGLGVGIQPSQKKVWSRGKHGGSTRPFW